ncbi:MAG: sigma-54-dependent Fis family transcriptional regulator [Planctomycetes bacterium]|nr:sigma-54-dependent Fis family transcriptional regulator [Planctomycetota bacterium]
MDYKKYRILHIDDELGWCKMLKEVLQECGFEVEYETQAANTLKIINSFKPHAILLDVLFGDTNRGKTIFKDIKQKNPLLTIVMLTNTVTEDDFKLEDYPGCAFAYAKNQINSGSDVVYGEFAEKIRRAIKNSDKTLSSLQREFTFVVGKTESMEKVCRDILNVASTNATILITGESGVGKGVIARAIKDKSKRNKGKFIIKSCTDFPKENMLISELFGHEKGAFTGAEQIHIGIFEEAVGGTVFIDEIGDATHEAQGRLLRVLEEKTIRRMKGNKEIKVDVRIITATNKNLESLIQLGVFREDLFHRLNQYRVTLPSLRDRKEDIPELLAYFIRKFNKVDERNILIETKNGEKDFLRCDVLDLLRSSCWPGNIREFENTVRKAMINAGDSNILLTNYFDIAVEDNKHKSLLDINRLLDEVFEGKWHGEDKWNEFVRTYSSKDWQKEIFQGCIERLKKSKQKKILKYQDLAMLFGISENNMRQRIYVLGMNWKAMKKS